jgi:hypothetical protein
LTKTCSTIKFSFSALRDILEFFFVKTKQVCGHLFTVVWWDNLLPNNKRLKKRIKMKAAAVEDPKKNQNDKNDKVLSCLSCSSVLEKDHHGIICSQG